MKTLHASELINMVLKNKIENEIELLGCIGPETDLVLLLDNLIHYAKNQEYGYHPHNTRFACMAEAVFHIMCLHYPDKAEQFIRNIESERVLGFILGGLLNVELTDVYTYCKENNDEVSIYKDKKNKIVNKIIHEVYLPKFKKVFEGKKILVVNGDNFLPLLSILQKENIIKEDTFIDFNSISRFTFKSVKKDIDYNKNLFKQTIKGWINGLKTCDLFVYREYASPWHDYDIENNKLVLNVYIKFNPKCFMKQSKEDVEGLIYGVTEIEVKLNFIYDTKTNICRLIYRNNDISITRVRENEKCKAARLASEVFTKLYGAEVKELFREVLNNKNLEVRFPNILKIPENKSLLDYINKEVQL